MNILNILFSFLRGGFACCEMAVDNGEIRRIDLQKQYDGSFVAEVVIEPCLDLMPFMLVHSVVKLPAGEDKSSHANHIIGCQVNKGFTIFMTCVVEILFDDCSPVADYRLVVAHEDVVAVEFYHFLEAYDDEVGLIDGEVEQFIKLSRG